MIGESIDLEDRPRECLDWLTLGPEQWPDDSGVVRGARPITDQDRQVLREQEIERMLREAR